METKILVGVLLAIGLIGSIGIGIGEAHGADESEQDDYDNIMAEMMGEMMNDEDFRNEMIEHMEGCPMMKHSDSHNDGTD